MTSAELRRIVGAMSAPPVDPLKCTDATCHGGHDPDRCPWLLGMHSYAAAYRAFNRHADALVALVEAVERMEVRSLIPPLDAQAVELALRAVHAIKDPRCGSEP